MNIEKQCKLCGLSVSIELFNYSNKAKGITKPYCKVCEKAKNKQAYLQNLEHRLESSRKWKNQNKDSIKEYNKNYYERSKTKQ